MANEINQADFEVVGQSINNEVPDPTKVPRAGQVSSQATAAMPGAPGMPGAPEGPAADAPMAAPMAGGAPAPIDQADFEAIDQADYEQLPEYANGGSPEFAINRSPLDLADRLKLIAGNKTGSLKFLKDKYEDATIDQAGNFKVKKDGLWYAVDPNGMGSTDAWESTKAIASLILPHGAGRFIQADPALQKELVADVAELTPMGAQVLAGTLGAAGGTLVGGPIAGSLAGAAAGAGALEAARTSLGRLVGTYETTPEEQLKDIGKEMLLGLGGQAVGLAVKPTVGLLRSSLKALSEKSNYAKELVSATTSAITKQPRWAIRMGMDAPEQVSAEVREALRRVGPGKSPTLGAGVLQTDQNALLTKAAGQADDALKGKYRQNLAELLKSTPDDYVFDVSTAAEKAKLDLVEAGYGKLNEQGVLKVLTEGEIARMSGVPEGQLAKVLGPKTKDAVDQIGAILNQYSKLGQLSGKSGAKKAIDLRRGLREAFDNLSGADVPDSIKGLVGTVKRNLEESVGQSFADKGVGEAFVKMNTDYASYADAVKFLKEAVESKNPQAIENLVKRLASKTGANQALKDEVWALSDLIGREPIDKILHKEAAKSFLDYFPGQSAGEGVLTSMARGAAGSTISSPRALIKQIEYGNRLLDFVKGSVKNGLDLASNDEALTAAFRATANAFSSEDEESARLLQEAGIDPNALGK